MTDTGLELGPRSLESSVGEFARENGDYYVAEFEKIQGKAGFTWSWNSAAALFGPFWGAWRGAWGFFWTFLVLELFALVQISRGLFGDLGAEITTRYEKLLANIAKREGQAAEALANGDQAAADGALKIAGNLKKAAANLKIQADAAALEAVPILITGLALIVLVKIVEGFYANYAYEAQYLRWRANPNTPSGTSRNSALFGLFMGLAIWPLTIYRFTVSDPLEYIVKVPIDKEYFAPSSDALDVGFAWLVANFGHVFKGVTTAIRWVLDGLEIVLIETPWPVVMVVIVVMALRLAGPRIAIFTAASLAYLALFGLWEASMETVALIGAGAFLCILFGIPLGIWFGKSKRAYAFSEPVLDFMQTMPAFVYLIPIIAFFGTGSPPGVLATIIFAMPPVIRLTALGMRGVPDNTKEAAVAFGCTKWQLLSNVEVPLAMPSIMTGINQTILMALSMTVIASLIGAGGLGANILEALQYAAKGQGLIAGGAILLCAMVLDRIVQGSYRRKMEGQ